MRHQPVGSIAAGCRSPLVAVIDVLLRKPRSTDSQCFSMSQTTSKIVPYRGGSSPSSNTWIPWANPSHPPNGISIGSAVFSRPTNLTNGRPTKQTYRSRYSVCSNRPHPATAGTYDTTIKQIYVGLPYCRAEMYARRVACCPLVSHGEHRC